MQDEPGDMGSGLGEPMMAGMDEVPPEGMGASFTPDEPPSDPQAVEGEDGVSEEGEYDDPEGGTPWYAGVEGFSEDDEEFFARQSYETPEQALVALRESAELRGQQSNEVGELRGQLAAMQQMVAQLQNGGGQQAPQQQSMSEQLPMIEAQIQQAIDNGEMDVAEGIARITYANRIANQEQVASVADQLRQEMDQRYGGQIQNLATTQLEGHFQQSAAKVQQQLGANLYNELAPKAKAYIEQRRSVDPNFGQNPEAINMAFQNALFEHQARQQARQSAAVTGAGAPREQRARQADPAKAILDEIDAVGGGNQSGGFL